MFVCTIELRRHHSNHIHSHTHTLAHTWNCARLRASGRQHGMDDVDDDSVLHRQGLSFAQLSCTVSHVVREYESFAGKIQFSCERACILVRVCLRARAPCLCVCACACPLVLFLVWPNCTHAYSHRRKTIHHCVCYASLCHRRCRIHFFFSFNLFCVDLLKMFCAMAWCDWVNVSGFAANYKDFVPTTTIVMSVCCGVCVPTSLPGCVCECVFSF